VTGREPTGERNEKEGQAAAISGKEKGKVTRRGEKWRGGGEGDEGVGRTAVE